MSKHPTSRYLDEIIDYGGIPITRGEAIADMQSQGIDQPCIDRWLQGQEFMPNAANAKTASPLNSFSPSSSSKSDSAPTSHRFPTFSPANHHNFAAKSGKVLW